MEVSSSHINLSGQILDSSEWLASSQKQALPYSKGLFETMRISKGRIALIDFHFERLFSGLKILGMDTGFVIREEKILEEILSLCELNTHNVSGRIRLSVYHCPDHHIETIQYLIETFPFDIHKATVRSGLKLDIYPGDKKAINSFSQLKSINDSLFSRVTDYARENALDDCFIMNSENRLAETSIANIFCIKDQRIFTPGLTEGPVAGVMRRWLLEKGGIASGYEFIESEIDPAFLESAEEIFLSNALRGVRPVRFLGNIEYRKEIGTGLALIVEDLLSGDVQTT